MEIEKKAFFKRYQEINNIYNGLSSRQFQIRQESTALNRDFASLDNQEVEVSQISEMLTRKSSLKMKHSILEDEYKSLEEMKEKIQKDGGLDHLFKTDETLKTLGETLYKSLLSEAKKDNIVRENLENRYEKAIAELMKLDEERKQFNAKSDEQWKPMKIIYQISNGEKDMRFFKKSYTLQKANTYNYLSKIKQLKD